MGAVTHEGLIDLAAARVGGRALVASDEFFASRHNLLAARPPIFIEGKYTDRGKWMDGWETRRRHAQGLDWCIIKLGLPGIVRGIVVDTSHFKGNFPEVCSLEACAIEGIPSSEQLLSDTLPWIEVLPQANLKGDSVNQFAVSNDQCWTHVRFKIYPDGGVARLRVFGEVVPDWNRLKRIGGEIDVASVENGG